MIKSDLNWQREIRLKNAGRFFTARHIKPTPTPGRQGAVPILDIRKGGYYKQQVPQNAGVTTTGSIYNVAASHGGPDGPKFPEVSHFRKETLTMQAISQQSHFHVPVSRLPVGEADTKQHYDGSATI